MGSKIRGKFLNKQLFKEYFLKVDGQKIHYLEKGQGEPLILVHGWLGSSAYGFEYVIPGLAKYYCVIAPDLPGFGESEELPGKHTIGAYVGFLFEFIQKKKLTKVSLAGFSLGGAICLKFAAEYPEYLEKLVLVGTSYRGADFPFLDRLRATFFRFQLTQKYFGSYAKKKILESLKSDSDFWNLNPQDQKQIRWEMQRTKVRPAAESINSLFQQDLTKFCQKIKISTLVLDGEKAAVVSIKVSEKLHHLIPNSQLAIFPEAGHNLVMEKPEEFNKAVLDFLK